MIGARTRSSLHWWESEEHEMHDKIFEKVSHLDQEQYGRQEDNCLYQKLYGRTSTDGLIAKTYSKPILDVTVPHKLKLNIIKSICDSAQARIGKTKPKIAFLTSNANRTQQTKAKNLEKFVFGSFLNSGVYKIGRQVFRDSTITDIAAIHTFIRGQKIVHERVFANEILVDMMDGMYGTPTTIYRKRYYSRYALKQDPRFKKLHKEIDEASESFSQYRYKGHSSNTEVSEYVLGIEAWHLRSNEDATDGVYTFAISNCVLETKEWKRDYFPFTFMRWSEPSVGVYGESLTAGLVDIQMEINKILRHIQVAMHLGSSPKLLIPHGSKLVKNHWSNEIGAMIEYAGGVPPQLITFATVHPEMFSALNFYLQQAYQKTGMSEMFSQGKKPGGINSAVGLREMDDIDTERFAVVAQQYEEAYLDLSRQVVDCARDLYIDGVDLKANSVSKSFIEEINWSQVDMDDDKFVMQNWPQSLLPQRPEARMQRITEYLDSGFIDKEQAFELADMPDLDKLSRRMKAPLTDIENRLERILESGQYEPPDAFMDLDRAITMFRQEYQNYKYQEDANDERLEMLQRFVEEAKILIEGPQPTGQVDPAMAQGGMPVALPGMAPSPMDAMQMMQPGAAIPSPMPMPMNPAV